MTNDDGNSAFPTTTEHGGRPGMSLRDYFAAVALSKMYMVCDGDGNILDGELLAKASYNAADLMLAARKK